ncbi:MAG: hypothetical protein AAGI03_01915 [Pseudomonadota bacterium]
MSDEFVKYTGREEFAVDGEAAEIPKDPPEIAPRPVGSIKDRVDHDLLPVLRRLEGIECLLRQATQNLVGPVTEEERTRPPRPRTAGFVGAVDCVADLMIRHLDQIEPHVKAIGRLGSCHGFPEHKCMDRMGKLYPIFEGFEIYDDPRGAKAAASTADSEGG